MNLTPQQKLEQRVQKNLRDLASGKYDQKKVPFYTATAVIFCAVCVVAAVVLPRSKGD